MKKSLLLCGIAAITLASCTKNTTNNTIIAPLPAYTVNGIHDITLVNGSSYGSSMPITVQYSDSAQQVVSLALSPLPTGITMDSTWITSGIPTFTTTLNVLDTTLDGATPGTYPMTLTVTGANAVKRTYPFNIRVVAETPCSEYIVGHYTYCNSGCSMMSYTDSVYADPSVPNRIWITNAGNLGVKLYAKYNCNSQTVTVPTQTVNGVSYRGTGSAYYTLTSHHMTINLTYNNNTCSVNMN